MSIFSLYDEFKYIYPPRAEKTLKPELLEDLADGWIAQPKYNGSCGVLFINGDKDYILYNRHKEILSLQRPLNYLALNDSDKFMVLCGEYLNKNKTGEDRTTFNHKFIIWDILVWKGQYLLDWTVQARIQLLYDIYGQSKGCITTQNELLVYNHLILTRVEDVFLAPSYRCNFLSIYKNVIETDLYEGLVLKRSNAKLEMGFRESNNSSWQIKARKETNSYRF